MASMALASLATILLAATPISAQIFDITKYGAVADGTTDNSKAFLDAWTAACQIGSAASFVVPPGTFLVGSIILKGPCGGNTSPRVLIQGTVRAPSSLDSDPPIGWIEFRALEGLSVGGGGVVDGQGAQSWSLLISHKVSIALPIMLRFINVSDVIVANLTLVNSKGFHLAFQRSSFIKARHISISAPADSPNTDGVHICDSNEVDIAGLTIATGDDCIGIGPGSTNVSVSHITCGPGHGISIGSLGKYPGEQDVVGVRIINSTISHTTNGVRIKTWPGSMPSHATSFLFQNIAINNVSNPIVIDQVYCPNNNCRNQPSLVKVTDVTFQNITGSSNTAVAVKLMCSQSTPCQDVQFQDINIQPMPSVVTGLSSTCSNILGSAIGLLKPALCF